MEKKYQILVILLGVIVLVPAFAGGLNDPGEIQPGGDTVNALHEAIAINPIPSHCVNDTFSLSGNTSLPEGTSLRVTIRRGSFNPGIPPQQNPWYDAISERAIVTSGDESGNKWTYALNTTGSYPDEYLVYVEPYSSENIRAVAIFVLNATCIAGTFPEETMKNISPTENVGPVKTAPVQIIATATEGVRAFPENDTTGFVPVDVISIDPAIKSATSSYNILILTDEGKQNLLGSIDALRYDTEGMNITGDEKTRLKSSLDNIWEKYPVERITLPGSSGYPYYGGSEIKIQFGNGSPGTKLTETENQVLERIQSLNNYNYQRSHNLTGPGVMGNTDILTPTRPAPVPISVILVSLLFGILCIRRIH
jgi:hypothetical protein